MYLLNIHCMWESRWPHILNDILSGQMYSYVKSNFKAGFFLQLFALSVSSFPKLDFYFLDSLPSKNGTQKAEKSKKMKIVPGPNKKFKNVDFKVKSIIFGGCWAYESGLRIFVWPLEVPFFITQNMALLAKVPWFRWWKMALPVPRQNFWDNFYKPNIPQKWWISP